MKVPQTTGDAPLFKAGWRGRGFDVERFGSRTFIKAKA